MYLIVGATGNLGGEICRRLAAEGKPIRVLVRTTTDQKKRERLTSYGVELVEEDVCDRTSLDAVCQGVKAVISTVSSIPFSYTPDANNIKTVDTEGLINLIEAAQAAGVQRFLYTSFTMENDFPLRNAKREVEKRLKASELAYTILRPSYFMEAWLSPAVGFDYPNAKAQIYGSGENPISWISLIDVAKFTVESLDNPAARNATLELGGPEALSPAQVVKIFEELGGQAFEVQHVPEEALEEQQKAATDPMQASFTGLMRWYAQGDPIDMQATLAAFPVQLTSVRDYARRVFVAS